MSSLSKIAEEIYDKRIVTIDTSAPVALKLHSEDPGEPASPIFFNFRTKDNPRPGLLDEKLLSQIALWMVSAVHVAGIPYDAIAGIPRAGEPIAKAFGARLAREFNRDVQNITMQKEEWEGDRRGITKILDRGGAPEGARVLLIGDVVSRGDTKADPIQLLHKEGFKIAGVAVIMDREQGGKEFLEHLGCPLVAVFRMRRFLEQLHRSGRVTMPQVYAVEKYRKEAKASALIKIAG